ncbi:MAG: hypothetical protein AAF648_14490 [Pseudomonadota bacterium]
MQQIRNVSLQSLLLLLVLGSCCIHAESGQEIYVGTGSFGEPSFSDTPTDGAELRFLAPLPDRVSANDSSDSTESIDTLLKIANDLEDSRLARERLRLERLRARQEDERLRIDAAQVQSQSQPVVNRGIFWPGVTAGFPNGRWGGVRDRRGPNLWHPPQLPDPTPEPDAPQPIRKPFLLD